MFSRTLTAVTAFSAATLLSTAAFAGCGTAGCSFSHGAASNFGTQYGGVKTHTSMRHSSNTLAGSVMSAPSVSTSSSFGGTANCPSGTTLQSDGTCLAGASFGSSYISGGSTSYGSGSSYDAGSINSQLSSIGSGSSYAAPTTYSTPSYSTSSYSTPSYSTPSYAAPSYSNPTTVISGSSNGSGSASYSSSVGSLPSTSVTSNGSGSYTITSGGSSNFVSSNGSGVSYSAGQEYNGVSVPSLSSRFAGGSSDMSVSNSGSGSVSATYTDNSSSSYSNTNVTVVPFSTGDSAPLSSSYRLPGLGASETLTPTSCPVAVHNPSGAKVLGCYSVSRPAPKPQVHYTRVVRPVVYVRYPVPTPVPYTVNVPYPVRVNGLHQHRGYHTGVGGFFNRAGHGLGLHGHSNYGYGGGFGGAGFGGAGFNGAGFGGAGCGAGFGDTRYGDYRTSSCR